VRGLRQPAKVSSRNDVPAENGSKYLGREESRHVQQGVSSAFELNDGPLMLSNLLFQRPDGIEIDLLVHRCSGNRIRVGKWPQGFVCSRQRRCSSPSAEVGEFVAGDVDESDRAGLTSDAHPHREGSRNRLLLHLANVRPGHWGVWSFPSALLGEVRRSRCLRACVSTVLKSRSSTTARGGDSASEIDPSSPFDLIWATHAY
jgi:hypothetical protein